MKTKKRIIFESRELKLKIYLNKRDKFEILINSRNLSSWKDGETEFSEIVLKPKGLEIILSTGKKMIFIFSSLTLFVSPTGDIEFEKAFLLGDVEARKGAGTLENYVIEPVFSN